MKERLAIIGSGIAGLGCAHFTHARYDLTIYEQETRLQGLRPVELGIVCGVGLLLLGLGHVLWALDRWRQAGFDANEAVLPAALVCILTAIVSPAWGRRALAGFLAGVVATAAYDATRLGLVCAGF